MYADQTAKSVAPKEATLNHRLNNVSERLQEQCERIEGVLGRVNGTPTAQPMRGKDAATISPTLPLSTIVEHLESVQARLTELAHGVERIA